MPRARHPPRPTLLLLVRHAVTAESGPVLSGRKPGIDLSDAGRQQADAVAERLSVLPVDTVYASPIERTTQTAQAIAARHGLEVKHIDGMIEADYGDWTGQKLVDLAKTDLWKVVQQSPSRAVFPSGEAIQAMQARAVVALEATVAHHPGEVVVVVSHSDVIKAAVAHFSGMHLDMFQRIVIDPTSITALACTPAAVAVLKLNDTGSLADLLPPPKLRKPARAKAAARSARPAATERPD